MNAENLVSQMSIEEVVAWAGLLQVKCTTYSQLDEAYPEREGVLRAALVGAMEKSSSFNAQLDKSTQLPSGIRARLRMLVRDELRLMLVSTDTSTSVLEAVHENFFPDSSSITDEFEKQVSAWCDVCYSMYTSKMEQLLQKLR